MKNPGVILAVLLLFTSSRCLRAQQPQTGSLKRLATFATTDTAKGRLLLQIASQWLKADLDSAYAYSVQSKELFNKANYKQGVAEALTQQGIIKVNQNNFDTGFLLYREALTLHEDVNNTVGKAAVFNAIGVAYGMQEYYSKALPYFLKALKIYEEKNAEQGMANSYLRIGVLHAKTNNLDDALFYYNRALSLATKLNDLPNMASLYNNIGSVYGQKKQFKEALQALQKSKEIAEKIQQFRTASEAYLNLGNAYRELKKYDSAQYHFHLAEQHFTKHENKESLARTYDGLAELYILQNKQDAAKQLINKSIVLANQINNKSLLYNNYSILFEISMGEKDYKSALEYQENLLALKDSLHVAERSEILERLKAEYQLEKNEMVITQLQKENVEKTKQRNVLLTLMILGMLLLILLVISLRLIYKNNIKLQKSKVQLLELNTMKDKFLSVISHDLRYPLASILQLLHHISITETNRENDFIFNRLMLSTSAVLETMDNMLVWGNRSFSKEEINRKQIDLAALAKRVCRFLELSANNKDIEIQNYINSPMLITADENQLEFVVRNLISNAIKFSHEHSKIELFAIANESDVKLHVKDYGVGMQEAQQLKLFKLNERESTKGTTGETGSGLGLMLSKEFIDLHDGQLTVESETGKGTEFIVTLPASTN